MSIGDRIKNRRIEIGMTLKEVAEQIGVKEATVQRYESGNIKNLKQETIAKIAQILKVSPAYLMGWEQQKSDSNIVPITGMVPIIGSIPAGIPVLAEENIEGYMPVAVKDPKSYFWLRVKGESMKNAGISDGSLVLIHQQPCAEDGEIVACRVNGDEATLKRFKKVNDSVVLVPENPEFHPIIVSKRDFASGYAKIIGVAKQVMTNL